MWAQGLSGKNLAVADLFLTCLLRQRISWYLYTCVQMTYRHDAAHLTHIIHSIHITHITHVTTSLTLHITHLTSPTSHIADISLTVHIAHQTAFTSHIPSHNITHIAHHMPPHHSHLTSYNTLTSHHISPQHSHLTSHYKNCATKNFLDRTPVRELPRQMHMEEVEEPASTKSTMHNTLKTMPDQRKVGEFYDKGTANRKLRELPRKSHSQPIQKRRRTPKSTKINTNNAHRRS